MSTYLSFHVQLLDAKPPIWRSFLLTQAASFADLHMAIQDACGWENSHLYEFRDRKRRQTIAGSAEDTGEPSSKRVRVASHFAAPDQTCVYEYDFGDGWLHEVRLVEIVTLDERFTRRLFGGKRAFPPEDCGGIGGYEDCVAICKGKSRGLSGAELRERREWLGDWQPEAFDLEAARRGFDR